MKQALLDLRKEKEDQEEQLRIMKARCTELELEQADTSNKYLKLYDENDRLQELLSTCQAQML